MSFINRDPDEMIKYAVSARQILEQIEHLMSQVENVLDSSAPDLDDPTQKEIEKLHACCAAAKKAFEKYRNTADIIEKKGIALKSVREGSY